MIPVGQRELLMDWTDGTGNLCLGGHFVPELLVMGAPKTGTTSLCTTLRKSPALMWPHADFWKEGHYFTSQARNAWQMMLEDFPVCDKHVRRVAVDGSAEYSSFYGVPKRIQGWYGPAMRLIKFVLLMREPLNRLHSHYHHSHRHGWCSTHVTHSFSQIVDMILGNNYQTWLMPPHGRLKYGCSSWLTMGCACNNFLEGSLYVNQLKQYLNYFTPNQFYLVPYLFNVDPGGAGRANGTVAEMIWSILGVKAADNRTIVHANHGHHPSLEEDLSQNKIAAIRNWFELVAGPRIIADFLQYSSYILYGYHGQANDKDAIEEWIRTNW